jgi:hypothetical protein
MPRIIGIYVVGVSEGSQKRDRGILTGLGGGDLVIPVPEASLAVCLRLWDVEYFILAEY